ncbi:MAG: COX15/CtaA family protein [Pseudomonadota bacterium]
MNQDSLRRLYRRLLNSALLLTFTVVVLGAWVRLTHAGLGCPDWPGCYGSLVVPDDAAAQAAFPERPLETGKAWREMIHRYAASLLGLVIIAIAAIAFRNRRDPEQAVALPLVLVALVIGQGLLGMLTVTLLLKPLIVLSHLAGGLTTLGLLFWLRLRTSRPVPRATAEHKNLKRLSLVALVVVALQIALGGWTSTNYAALACQDFPTCHQQWWPETDFKEAFVLWRGLGIDYEGGVLDGPARTAIHVSHRVGALITTLVLMFLALVAWRSRQPWLRPASSLMLIALVLQVSLGITIVLKSLPLALATAHNGVAALLLLALINLNQTLRYARH